MFVRLGFSSRCKLLSYTFKRSPRCRAALLTSSGVFWESLFQIFAYRRHSITSLCALFESDEFVPCRAARFDGRDSKQVAILRSLRPVQSLINAPLLFPPRQPAAESPPR